MPGLAVIAVCVAVVTVAVGWLGLPGLAAALAHLLGLPGLAC